MVDTRMSAQKEGEFASQDSMVQANFINLCLSYRRNMDEMRTFLSSKRAMTCNDSENTLSLQRRRAYDLCNLCITPCRDMQGTLLAQKIN